MRRLSLFKSLTLIALSSGLAACGGSAPTLNIPVSAANAYFLTSDDHIVGVDLESMEYGRSVTALPRATTATAVDGYLDLTEVVLDIDYRNSEGALYALTKTGSQGRIIRIDPATGSFIRVSTLVKESDGSAMNLSASSYTIDFNPVVDRLRIIGSNGDNWRADVLTGETLADTAITTNTITGAAYEDSFTSAGRGTRLLTLDAGTNSLYLQGNPNPNDGTQNSAKPLLSGTAVTSIDGYDINPANNSGLAIMTVGGVQRIYNITPAASSNAASLFGTPPTLTGGIKYKALSLITRANPTVLALTSNNSYYSFNANQPDQISNPAAISGLSAAGEKVIGIDMRQSDRKLYALTDASKLYTIDLASPAATPTNAAGGAATFVSDLKFVNTSNPALATNVNYTFDFNPVIATTDALSSRMRLIGDDDSNAIVEVESGTVTPSTNVSGTPNPTVVAAAYSNNYRNAISSSLLVIDRASASLNEQNTTTTSNPVLGALTRISLLGISLAGHAGMDISGRGNENILLMAHGSEPGSSALYRLSNVSTNSATLATTGVIGGTLAPQDLIDIAIRL